MTDLVAVGDRIAELVDAARASPDRRAGARAEELVALVTDLYAVGLARIVELLTARSPEAVDVLLGDEVVAGLLAVHGLHPEDLARRVEAALDSVRPLLAGHGGDVELVDLDHDLPAVRLRLLGSCDGCPSSAMTLRGAVEQAVLDRAPEIVLIDVDEPHAVPAPLLPTGSGPVPVALTGRPRFDSCPAEPGPV